MWDGWKERWVPLWRAHYHVTWSTTERRRLITEPLERRLFGAINAVADRHRILVHALDGTEDHLHAVLTIPPTLAVARVIGEMKGATAHLANHDVGLDGAFSWSRGYGLFTLGPRQLPRAIEYVRNQKEHHRAGTSIASLEATHEPTGYHASPLERASPISAGRL